ncbi:MAG: hypothetical protein IJ093_02630 [Bacilli bacterium]|nr:hypothetical protein [Bacilli bacterium]
MKINEAFKKYSLVPVRYENVGKVRIIDTDKGKFVFKEGMLNKNILDYLNSRNFDYLPKWINSCDDEFQITNYIDDFNIPLEQKIMDMISLVALLHSKTTHYKEVDNEEYEQLYDDLDNNITYLYSYYTDLITIIESKVYMSPSEYLLARNIGLVYDTLDDVKKRLEDWHKLIYEKRKQRRVVLHNHLKLDHFVRNTASYLISWDKAKIGNPVFDLYKLYLNHVLDFDFGEIFKVYEKHYPLLDDEKQLFLILISLPEIINFGNDEYDNTLMINKAIEKIYKTNEFTKTV